MDETDDELAAAQREHAAEEERSDAALDALKESLETCEAAAASLRDDASKLDVAVDRARQGSTRERNSQLQRLISRPFSTRFG